MKSNGHDLVVRIGAALAQHPDKSKLARFIDARFSQLLSEIGDMQPDDLRIEEIAPKMWDALADAAFADERCGGTMH